MSKDEGIIKKTARRLKEVYYGKETYKGKDFSPGSVKWRRLYEGENGATIEVINRVRKADPSMTAEDIAKNIEGKYKYVKTGKR